MRIESPPRLESLAKIILARPIVNAALLGAFSALRTDSRSMPLRLCEVSSPAGEAGPGKVLCRQVFDFTTKCGAGFRLSRARPGTGFRWRVSEERSMIARMARSYAGECGLCEIRKSGKGHLAERRVFCRAQGALLQGPLILI